MLNATPPVATGAPPVEVAEACADEAADEAEDEAEAALEVAAEEADKTTLLTAALEPAELDEPVAVAMATLAVPVAALASAVAVPVAVATAEPPSRASAKLPPAEVAQALTLLGRLLYQAGMVPASISERMESREEGSMISLNQLVGMAVSMTARMEVGIESRRAVSSSVADEEEVPVAWGRARAVAPKRKAARSLNCILDLKGVDYWFKRVAGLVKDVQSKRVTV
jgi:hypothetical protein